MVSNTSVPATGVGVGGAGGGAEGGGGGDWRTTWLSLPPQAINVKAIKVATVRLEVRDEYGTRIPHLEAIPTSLITGKAQDPYKKSLSSTRFYA